MELEHLAGGVVEPAALPAERPHLRERGDAHVEVVRPERLRLRPAAGERAVVDPELAVRDVVRPVVDHRPEVRADARATGLDHRRAHRAAVVERVGLDDGPEGLVPRAAEKRRDRPEVGQAIGDELQVTPGELAEPRVARRLARQQHARVRHAHRVVEGIEGVGLAVGDDRIGVGHREVRDLPPGLPVDDAGGSRLLEVATDTLEQLADLRHRGALVRDRIGCLPPGRSRPCCPGCGRSLRRRGAARPGARPRPQRPAGETRTACVASLSLPVRRFGPTSRGSRPCLSGLGSIRLACLSRRYLKPGMGCARVRAEASSAGREEIW